MSQYEQMLNKAAKDWNCPDMFTSAKLNIPKIPFSAPMLNYATYGGVPRGRISEFCGAPGSGKSSTAIDVCHNARELFNREFEEKVQDYRNRIAKGKKEYSGPLEDLLDAGPKKILYADIEHGYDFTWAAKMNIKETDLDVMQPPDVAAEKILQFIQDLIEDGQLGLVVLDSVPTLATEAQLSKKYGERTVASLAGLMTDFLRKIVPLLTKHDCTLILINQIRPNMENPYVINTPGGEAIKFYSTLRMFFRLGAPVDFAGNELPQSTENPSGYIVNVKLLKQKGAAFDRKIASYFLMAQSGIRPDFDYAKLAINKYGIIKKSGGWFTMCNPVTGEILEVDGKPEKVNGQVKVYAYLEEHPDYYRLLQEYILADINGVEFDPSSILPDDVPVIEQNKEE